MTYNVNGENRKVNFLEVIDDITYRSDVIDIIAKSYVNDGCPIFLEKNAFVIGYYTLMTDVGSNEDIDILEVAKQIKSRTLPYYKKMYRAYKKRVKYMLTGQSIVAELHGILKRVKGFIEGYENPEKIIEAFGNLDPDHLKSAMEYLKK